MTLAQLTSKLPARLSPKTHAQKASGVQIIWGKGDERSILLTASLDDDCSQCFPVLVLNQQRDFRAWLKSIAETVQQFAARSDAFFPRSSYVAEFERPLERPVVRSCDLNLEII